MNLSAILAQAGQQQAPPPWTNLVMFVPIIIIFYFLLIRPQQKRAKEQAKIIESVRSGDKILTSSGILGVVVTVKEKSVTIRSADSKMEISKSAIGDIVERSGESSSSES